MIIKKITKEKNNYQVVFEKETLVLKAAIIVRFGLHQGMEISHSLKREIIKANEKEIISSQALKYLAKARTINEFKEYLKSLNSPPEFSAELVADFVKKGYLNDRLYAENILNRYQKKYAKKRIEALLVEKGISLEIIEELLGNYQNKYLQEHLEKVVNNTQKSNLNKTKAAVLRKMINLGYQLKEVETALLGVTLKTKKEAETINKEFQKIVRKHQKNLTKEQLSERIKETLYRKGYQKAAIEKLINERENNED